MSYFSKLSQEDQDILRQYYGPTCDEVLPLSVVLRAGELLAGPIQRKYVAEYIERTMTVQAYGHMEDK